jgi:MFS family permease
MTHSKISNSSLLIIDDNTKRNIKLSILEGSFGTVMGTMIGGAFLTGFALTLGANDFTIGLLASLPLLANLVQIVGAYIISRVGSSKKVCITYVFFHRMLWASIILLPFVLLKSSLGDTKIWIFIILIAVSSICASITGISWLSWMTDLIPEEIRGRFFAKRNMAAQVVGMLVAVGAGRFIDLWKKAYISNDNMQSFGFAILFAFGTLFGLVCIFLLRKMSDPISVPQDSQSFVKQLINPLMDKKFLLFIIFSVAWGFSVGIVGPFFSVYMIKHLSVPFSVITLLGVAAGISGIVGTRLWGNLMDRIGPKLLHILCGLGASIVPFLWIFASPDSYLILWFINIVSGFCWAGIGLASSNMMIALAPTEEKSIYFAVFAAITGLFGALAPIVGGSIGAFYNAKTLSLGFMQISGLGLLFLTSTLLRFASLSLLKNVDFKKDIPLAELLRSIQAWQKFAPIYNIQNLSVTSFQPFNNITTAITQGMLYTGNKIEGLWDRSQALSKDLSDKFQDIDLKVDTKLNRYEHFIENCLNKIGNLLKSLVKLFYRD